MFTFIAFLITLVGSANWMTIGLLQYDFIAGIFGFPVEKDVPARTRLPWCTWSLAAVCIIVFLYTMGDIRNTVQLWGLIPSDCLREHGVTFITAMFLHGGLGHLIGNLYFLLIFGDNVEDVLGAPVYLALILASGLSAALLHIAIMPASAIPCIGASGFISGIIAAYAVFFPSATISIFIPRCCGGIWGLVGASVLRNFWFSVPAWGAFFIWFLYQLIMSVHSDSSSVNVAYGAHLGGAVLGIIVGFLLRNQVQKHMESVDN